MSRAGKIIVAIVAVLLIALVVGYVGLRLFEPRLKAELIRSIEERFDAKAELQSLDITLFPRARIEGNGLVLWYKGRHDIPPLIKLDQFTADAHLPELFHKPRRIAEVNLKGLLIQIPPDQDDEGEGSDKPKPGKQEAPATGRPSEVAKRPIPHFVIARVHADGTVLRILPKSSDKDPLEFTMHRLVLNAVDVDRPFQYQSTLKNAKPPGMITSKGEFGPWNTSDPGGTPVAGVYKFREADLSIFKGISGTLASDGEFKGVLKKIVVDGTTDVPNFTVRTGKEPVHLKTKFHAIVDGTKGDTLLQPVVATFGQTTIHCEGGVIKKKGLHGKSVILDVRVVNDGRIEDILKFVVPGKPPVVGEIRFTAKMELPPGDVDVIKKLRLNGTFGVSDAKFTTATVQGKIEELSLKSRGKHDEVPDERIVSDLKGSFVVRNGVASFSNLAFMVPGATVDLKGSYNLASGEIDFEGTVRMQAKLSQTQKGVKSLLLKVVDPFFRKGKVTVLPIKITGTRDNPKFGLRIGGGKKKD